LGDRRGSGTSAAASSCCPAGAARSERRPLPFARSSHGRLAKRANAKPLSRDRAGGAEAVQGGNRRYADSRPTARRCGTAPETRSKAGARPASTLRPEHEPVGNLDWSPGTFKRSTQFNRQHSWKHKSLNLNFGNRNLGDQGPSNHYHNVTPLASKSDP
jgi:hypothetical protein